MSEYPITVGFNFPHTMLFTIQNLAAMTYAMGKEQFIKQFMAVFCANQTDEKTIVFYQKLAEVTYQHAFELYTALIEHYDKTLRYDSQLNFTIAETNENDIKAVEELLDTYLDGNTNKTIEEIIKDIVKGKEVDKKDDFSDLPPMDFELN